MCRNWNLLTLLVRISAAALENWKFLKMLNIINDMTASRFMQKLVYGDFLVVQWLRLHPPNAWALGINPLSGN